MNLRKLLGLQPKDKNPYKYIDVLHMWEDDYLMIELLPKENSEFIIKETKRIDKFGQEHFDGSGFTDITIIGNKPVKTIDKQIPINVAEQIFRNSGLLRIEKAVIQGLGFVEGDKVPLGYGNNKFAIILEGQSDLLENIWLTGRIETDSEREMLKQGLKEFGELFSFIGVNWFKSHYYDLTDRKQIDEYLKSIC